MILPSALHILLFGDSLTAGLIRTSMQYHPYQEALQTSLETAFPTTNITMDVHGVVGDDVITPPGSFLTRMSLLYSFPTKQYTHAVILGGINDIALGYMAPEIYDGLQKVWAIPLQNSTSVLALTLTQCSACIDVPLERIQQLNSDILAHQGGENFHTLDLGSKVSWGEMPDEQRKEIWDDGVHFTERGYDMIGQIIAERLIEVISVDQEKYQVVQRKGASNTGIVFFFVILGIIIYQTGKARRRRKSMHEVERGDAGFIGEHRSRD